MPYQSSKEELQWDRRILFLLANLFISVTKRKKLVSGNTILFCIILVIIHVYESATDDDWKSFSINV